MIAGGFGGFRFDGFDSEGAIVLPRRQRLTRAAEFRAAARGPRCRRTHVVVQVGPAAPGTGVRMGLVVGKTVGNSVVRHRVSRRLRDQFAARIDRIPAGTDVVLRALPSAALATSEQFGADLDSAFQRLFGARRSTPR